MASYIIPFCLAAIAHASTVRADFLQPLEARVGPTKGSGASGSDSLLLDDYSAEDEHAHGGVQMTTTNIIIISVVSGVSFILIAGSIFLCIWLRRRRKHIAARTSFSEDTHYVPNNGVGEHHQDLKVDEHQPLYQQQQPAGLNGYPAQHGQHLSHASHISHESHASHDSTHDPHLSLLSACDYNPPSSYSNSYGNSPPNQYSPLQSQGVVGYEPSYPAPTAVPNGVPHLNPVPVGQADAYYGR